MKDHAAFTLQPFDKLRVKGEGSGSSLMLSLSKHEGLG